MEKDNAATAYIYIASCCPLILLYSLLFYCTKTDVV